MLGSGEYVGATS